MGDISLTEQERLRREPGGAIYFAALARRGGREYTGGPVCWDPAEACEGICWVCPRTGRPILSVVPQDES